MVVIKASQFILFAGQFLNKLLMEFKQCQKSTSMIVTRAVVYSVRPKVSICIEMKSPKASDFIGVTKRIFIFPYALICGACRK